MLIKFFKRVLEYVDNPYKGLLTYRQLRKLKQAPRHQEGEVKFLKSDLSYTDPHAFLVVLKEQFVENQYYFEWHTASPSIVDCGANIGLSVLYFKNLFPKAKIAAFEPDKYIFKILQKNIAQAGLTDVSLFNEAVWIDDTELVFYTDKSLAGSIEFKSAENSGTQQIKAIRLRDFLEKQTVDFLKIDIEGAESTVLFDIHDKLKDIPYLFVEYHSNSDGQQKLGELLTMFTNAGYRYYIKNGWDYCRRPFADDKKTPFDMYINIYCYNPGLIAARRQQPGN